MTNSKSTKRALVSSALAILMCVAMLIGTTFAWFTDTASTGVNKIVSGNLHVEIQNEAGRKISNLEWLAKDGRAQDAILWEPGATYTLTPFKIANTGNLALKYKLVVNGLDGDAELLDVIHFTYNVNNEEFDLSKEGHLTAGAATDMITVSATMDKNAGNTYMEKKLEGVTINVYATQDTVESDSFSNQYDEKATYPAILSEIRKTYGVDGLKMPEGVVIEKDTAAQNGHFVITLKDEESFLYFTQVFDRKTALKARETALTNGTATKYEGESVHNSLNIWYYENVITLKMDCDIDLGESVVNPFSYGGIYFDGNGHTIRNAMLTGSSGNIGFFGRGATVSNVVFDNIQVTATGCDSAGVVTGSTNTNITNVTVKNSSVIGAKYTGAVVGYNYGSVTNCTVDKTNVTGQYKVGGIIGYICEDVGKPVSVTGNKLKKVTVKGENLWSGKNDFVIGKVVGNWNAMEGTCKDNTFSGTTKATSDIGEIEDRAQAGLNK